MKPSLVIVILVPILALIGAATEYLAEKSTHTVQVEQPEIMISAVEQVLGLSCPTVNTTPISLKFDELSADIPYTQGQRI